MTPHRSTQPADWGSSPPDPTWNSPATTARLLGGTKGAVPPEWARACAARLRRMTLDLRSSWTGMSPQQTGPITDWVLACLLARENLLLLGPPGCAKTQIATRTFKLLGLRPPEMSEDHEGLLRQSLETTASPWQ